MGRMDGIYALGFVLGRLGMGRSPPTRRVYWLRKLSCMWCWTVQEGSADAITRTHHQGRENLPVYHLPWSTVSQPSHMISASV